jgi:predicted membrane-bound spermidine synthase
MRFAAPRSLYFAIFAISGFSGLIYESIWSHYLKLFLGHAAYAQSLVLIIFMGGMALGSWLASRYSEKRRSPLLLYAGAELIVGLVALTFHGVFTSIIENFYTSILPSIESPLLGASLKWMAASTLIMPQSVLLGMTFPLMSAGIIRRYPDTPGRSIAMLYFTNSIGAAIGVLVSGFWFIKFLGLPGTMLTAGLMNIGLAVIVWMLVRLDPTPGVALKKQGEITESSTTLKTIFLVAAFITGAASFIYEISWIRMLSLVLGATTHSFELMLSAFITGLAFGGFWIKRRIDRIESPVRFSGYVQLIMGALALLTLPVYVMSFGTMEWLLGALQKTDAGYTAFTFASHSIALMVMLPTTFMAGMTLPLFTYVLIRRGLGEASIGQVYAANTIGAIVGVLFAVHIGLPLLGLKALIVFGAALDIVLGLFLLLKFAEAKGRRFESPAVVTASLVAIALTVSMASLDKEMLVSGIYRSGNSVVGEGAEVVYYADGKTATVALIATPDGRVSLTTNGKSDAAIDFYADTSYGGDEITMTLLGALPMAYMPGATTVANIGLGSGMTTHTMLGYENIRRLDTIEIEPAMVLAAHGFADFVARAFNDPRSRIHIEDAKTYFSLNNSVYDIIVAEPSNPWVSGVSSLFTTEFYASIRRHIVDGGLFVQWIQLYEFDNGLAQSILKALSQNFSDYVIYTTNGGDLVFIARNGGPVGSPDWPAMFATNVVPQLAKYGIRNVGDIEFRRLVDRASLLPMLMASDIPVNSDYYPYVDLHAGQARFKKTRVRMFDHWSVAPIPVLEMLQGYSPMVDDLTIDRGNGRLRMYNDAQWQFERIVNNALLEDLEAVSTNIPANAVVVANLVRSSLQQCEPYNRATKFRYALHDLMVRTLPFLSRAQASEFVGVATSSACEAEDHFAAADWIDLYRAVAERNASGMLHSGRAVLALPEEYPTVLREYALASALLGAIAVGSSNDAAELWLRWRDVVYVDGRPSEYVRFLSSIAVHEAANSAPH